MSKVNYVQVSSFITYYLEMYPHVGVALEATLEDVEGDGKMAKEVREAMERIYAGEEDVKVLSEWADKTGSRDLEKLAKNITEARAKGIDIGLYARRLSPQVHNQQNAGRSNNKRKNFGRKGSYRKRQSNRRER